MIRSEYLQKIAAEDAEKIKKSGYLTLEVKNAMEQNRLAVAEYARKNNWSNVEKEHLSERVICPTDKIFIDDIKVPLHPKTFTRKI